MAFNINEIKSQLVYGGARNSLFSVQFANPVNSAGDLKVPFLIKASSLPESSLGNIQVPYFGRKINVAGDRTFSPWRVTVMNDEDFLIRNAMETWSTAINSLEGNINTLSTSSPALYKVDASVTQYSRTGAIIRVYTMVGAYPVDVEGIGMDWGSTDQIEEFNVTFMYDNWFVSGGNTGAPIV